jgi:hypothetical protein
MRLARRTTSCTASSTATIQTGHLGTAIGSSVLSELPQILGMTPVRSELVWLLVALDKEYTETNPDAPWPQWYAERILTQFATPAE